MSDFVASLDHLGVTLRLSRLADRLSEDARRLYGALDLPPEPSWNAIRLLLRDQGPLSVTEAATHLGLKHPSVVAASRKLEQAGLVVAAADPQDKRRSSTARLPALSSVARRSVAEGTTGRRAHQRRFSVRGAPND